MANHHFVKILMSVPLAWTIVARGQPVEISPDIINVFNTRRLELLKMSDQVIYHLNKKKLQISITRQKNFIKISSFHKS